MKRTICNLALALFAAVTGFSFLAATAQASNLSPGFTYDGSLGANYVRSDQYTIGNSFTSSRSLTISELGVQDMNSSGTVGQGALPNSGAQVGLWDSLGNLLASATVTNGDPLGNGGYRYADLTTPVTLSANTTYIIGALVGNGVHWGDSDYISPNVAPAYAGSVPLGVTITGTDVLASNVFGFPSSNGGGDPGRWAPANFQVTPEPSSLVLCGLGALGLFVAARRRRKA